MTYNTSVSGVLYVSVYDNSKPLTPLPASVVTPLVDVLATVPGTATYGAGALLKLTNVQVNGGNVAAAGDEAVQKVAFLGDATGGQLMSVVGGLDASDIARVVVNLQSGFSAYADTDPIIIGDVSGYGFLSGLDASLVAQASVGLPVPQIPALPAGVTLAFPSGNIDPDVTVGSVTAAIDSTADVSLTIDNSLNLIATGFTISYNSSLLSLPQPTADDQDVTLGPGLSGWGISVNAYTPGTVIVVEYGTYPLGSGSNVDLLDLYFQTLGTAATAAADPVTITTGNLFGNVGGIEGPLALTTTPGSVTITGATPTLSVSDSGWTYGQSAVAPVATEADVASPSVTYAYAGVAPTVYASSTPPTQAGTYSVTATFAATAGYTSGTATADFTISPLAVTLSGSRSYDGTATAAAGILTVSDLVGSDNLTLTGSVALAGKDAPSEAITSFSGLTLGGLQAGDYTLTGASGTVTINAVGSTVTVTPGASTVTYDGSQHGATATWASTGTDGEGGPLTVYYVGIGGTSYASTTTAPTSAGEYAASATFAGNSDHSGNSNSADFTISPLAVTLSGSRSYDGTATAAAGILTVSDLVGSDNLTLTGSVALAGKDAPSEAITSFSGLTLGGLQAGDYTLTGASGTVTINAVGSTVTVTPGASTVTYDGHPHGATATWASTGTDGEGGPLTVYYVGIGGTSYASTTTAPTSAGEYAASATFAGNSDHSGNSNSADFTISPLAVTLSGSRSYDGTATAAAGILTVSDLVGSDNLTLTGSVALAGKDAPSEAITSFSGLTLGGLQAGDYTLTGASGTVTINAVGSTVTVTPGASTVTYDGSQHGATATWASTGTDGEGGPLTVYYVGIGGTSYASTTTAPTSAGEYAASATFAGNSDHSGNSNSADFTISPLAVTLSGSRSYDGTATAAAGILTVSDLVGSDNLTLTGSVALAGKDAPSEAITSFSGLTLGGLQAGDYTLTGASGTVTINAVGSTVTVTPGASTVTYDGSQHGATATWASTGTDGEGGPLTVYYVGIGGTSYASTTTAPTSAGEYAASATFAGNSDHSGNSNSADFTISPLAVTLSGSRSYDGTATAAAGILTVSDLVGSDNLTLTGSVALAGKDAPSEAITSFSGLTLGGLQAGDYTLTGASGTVTINAVGSTVTVTPGASTVTYDGSQHGATATWASTGTDGEGGPLTVYYVGIGGTSYASTTTAPTSAGEYAASATFAGNSDHSGNSNSADFTISPLAVTLSGSRSYDGTATAAAGILTVSDLVGSDNLTLTGSVALAGKDAPSEAITSFSGLTLGGLQAGDYTLTGASGTVTINAVGSTVTVTPGASTVTYDGHPHGATATWASTGTDGEGGPLTVYYVGIGGTSYASTTTAPTSAGEYEASATFAGNSDHSGNSNSADFTISPLAVTLSGSRSYDGTATAAAGILTVSDLVGSDNLTLTGSVALAGKDAPSEAITSFSGLTLGGLQAGDYTLTGASGTVTINAVGSTVTVTPGASTVTYDGSQHGATATWASTGTDGEGGPLTVYYVGIGGTSYASTTTAPTSAGEYAASATFAGNSDHSGNSNSADFTISPLAVTLSGSRSYDGTATAAAGILTVSDLVGSDNLTLTGSVALAGKDAPSEAITSFSGLTLGGLQAGDYTLTGASGTVTINAVGSTVTVTPGASTVTYDGSQHGATATWASTGTDGEGGPLTVYYVGIGGTSYASTTTAPTSAGEYAASATFAGNSDHSGNSNSADFTISPLAVTLSGSRSYDGTATAAAGILTVSDLVGSDNLTLTGSVALAGKDAPSEAITSFSGLTLGGLQAGDYTLTGASGTVTINAVGSTVTVTPGASTVTYDGSQHGATATWASTGTDGEGGPLTVYYVGIGGTSYASTTTAPTSAGEYAASATFAGNSDHSGNSNSADFTISPLAVTLSGSRSYDGTATAAAGILTVSDLVGSDNLTLTGSVALAGKDAPSEAITSFSGLTLGGLQAGDYTLTGASGTVTMNAVGSTVTVTPGASTVTYDGSQHGATATWASTGTDGEGGPLTVYYVGIGGTSYASTTTAPTSAGEYAASATFAGNSDHSGNSNSADFTISPLAVTLSGSRSYDGTATAAAGILTVSDLVGSDNLTLTGSVALAGKDAPSEAITSFSGLTLGGLQAGDYTLTGASGTVTINAVGSTVTVTPGASTVTYDGHPHGATATWASTGTDGEGGPLTVYYVGIGGTSYASTTTAPTSAGEYAASATFAGNSDHSGNSNSADFTISPLAVTLSGSRSYEGTATAAAGILTVSDLVGSDNLTLTGSVALAGEDAPSEAITSFSGLTLGGLQAGDYTLTGPAAR